MVMVVVQGTREMALMVDMGEVAGMVAMKEATGRVDMAEAKWMVAMGEVVLEEDEMGGGEVSMAAGWFGTRRQIKLLNPVRLLL